MKYRVIKEYGEYIPQMKQWRMWMAVNEPVKGFETEEEAIAEIRLHKKMFGKRRVEVVYEEG